MTALVYEFFCALAIRGSSQRTGCCPGTSSYQYKVSLSRPKCHNSHLFCSSVLWLHGTHPLWPDPYATSVPQVEAKYSAHEVYNMKVGIYKGLRHGWETRLVSRHVSQQRTAFENQSNVLAVASYNHSTIK